MRPLDRKSVPSKVRGNTTGVKSEKRKPNVPGRWVYVETGDPELDTFNSPEWENDFYYISPVGFRHGLDGQTDMIGVYDLTLGAVSGGTAFHMPLQWAQNVPLATMFPVELDTDVWSLAIQKCDVTEAVSAGVPIKIYWPIVADDIPP